MAKLPDWQANLDRYILDNHAQPFSYDERDGLDCCRFSFGAIAAQTGVQIQMPGHYRTQKEALILMKEYSGRPYLPIAIAKIMAEYGFASVAPLSAQRGDAIITPNAGSYFLGILSMNGKDVLSVGEHGLRRVPISVRCRAWRVA